MRLSEAMMLGHTRYKLNPELWACEDGGCLLGVAGYAAGVQFTEEGDEDFERIIDRWPWLINHVTSPAFAFDCGQSHLFSHLHNYPFENAAYCFISCLAFELKNGVVTIEQVVDWVRSVEPSEPEPVEFTTPVTEAVCA